jgi:hypothetical protein
MKTNVKWIIVVDEGGVSVFVGLLKGGSVKSKELAARVLSVLTGEFKIIKDDERRALMSSTDKMKDVQPGKEANMRALVQVRKAGGIKLLVKSLRKGGYTAKIVEYAVLALGNLAENAANKAAIVKMGGIPTMVDVLRHGTPAGKAKAAGALWAIASEDNIVAVRKAGGIPVSSLQCRSVVCTLCGCVHVLCVSYLSRTRFCS